MDKNNIGLNLTTVAAIIFPKQTAILGLGKTEQSYREHVPDLFDLALVMLDWLTGCSSVQISSSSTKPKKLFPPTYPKPSRTENISATRLTSVLLGRKTLLVSNRKTTYTVRSKKSKREDGIRSWITVSETEELMVKWYVQPIPSLNIDTGEIHEGELDAYTNDAISAGYLTFPYRLSSYENCVLVVLGNSVAFDVAVGICKSLARSSTIISPKRSSLFDDVLAPLSLNSNQELCSWINIDLEQSKEIFQQIIRYQSSHQISLEGVIEPDPVSPPLQEQILEIASLPELDDQPYTLPTDWIVERNLRQQLIEFLDAEDKNALKMLGLYLFGRKCQIYKDPIADERTIAALFNWEKKRKNNKAIVGPALKFLSEHVKIVENPHSYRGLSTSFKLPDLPPNLTTSSKNLAPYTDPVLLGSGGRIREFVAKRMEEKLDVARSSTSNYPNQTTDSLLEHLNNLPTNYFQKTTNEHMDRMLDIAELLEGESRMKALSTLRDIQLFPKPIYKRSRKTCRIYTVGSSYQNLSRNIRNIAFRGNLKVDLRHSQLSIACYLYGYRGLDNHLRNGTLWDFLVGETGLSKGRLKSILYSSFFMSAKEFHSLSNPALNLPDIEIDDVRKFGAVREIQELMDHRTIFINSKLDFVQEDAFKNKFQDIPFNEKLAALSQCLELKILSTSIGYVLGLKDHQISLFLHDGFFIKGDSTKFSGIAEKMKLLVDEQLRDLGIISGLDVVIS
jgi:hypothetical protein